MLELGKLYTFAGDKKILVPYRFRKNGKNPQKMNIDYLGSDKI